MKHRTVSASGAPQEPLPAEVPRDEDHIVTPRDLRAERLAAELEGRTGHRDPLTVAQQIEKITGRKHHD